MKKLLVSLLISIFLFTSYSFAYEYEDVPFGDPYFTAIDYLRTHGVFRETNTFRPELIISKAEFIKYLVLLNRPGFKTSPNVVLPFEDTVNTAWYASYFKEAIALGILSDRDAKVDPYKKLTLIDALQLLFHSQSIPIPRIHDGIIQYTDIARNTRFAPLMMRALDFDLFVPQRWDYAGIYRRITRAEAARMIYKMDLVNITSVSAPSNLSTFDTQLQKIISSWDLIHSNFIGRDDVDEDKLADGAIKGMIETLEDPYSAYLDPSENAAFSDDLDGEIEGIGAYIAVDEEGGIIIVSPLKDSPAERAGIEAGDVIIEVDDINIIEMSLYEAVNLIKGPRGTSVRLTIKRNGSTRIINVVRDVIKIGSLEYEVIENGKVMLITMSQFSQRTPAEFQEAVELMQNSSSIKGLIIDVRDNPGGLLDSVIRVLNFLLLPESEIVTIQYNYFNYTQFASGGGELAKYPMVVLINKGSASAAEILAGALKDFKLAKIVGETSFGKGSVQEMTYFMDNSSLKLTIAKWLTPLNHSIDGNGIKPDITVLDNPNTTADEQMNRAISELNREM